MDDDNKDDAGHVANGRYAALHAMVSWSYP